METLEERALKAFPPCDQESEMYRRKKRLGYIKGATEQKAIDIEKACINFCVACPTYENCDTRYNCPIYDKFEKAMEE